MKLLLTPGDKVREIRKRIKASQSNISGTLSRVLISQIENNKVVLTKSTAVIISNNINEYCKLNGIQEDYLDYKILLETKTQQADKIIKEYIIELINIDIVNEEELFNKSHKEIKDFLDLYQAYVSYESLTNLYEILIELSYKNNNYEKAEIYILTCFKLAISKNDTDELIRIISIRLKYLYRIKKYADVITWSNVVIQFSKRINIETNTLKRIHFNMLISYSELKDYTNATITLKYMLKTFNLSKLEYIYVKIVEGICLNENKQYLKAEEIYLSLLKNHLNDYQVDYNSISNIYTNLADTYNCLHLIEKRNLYINLSLKLANSNTLMYERKIAIYEFVLKIYLKDNDFINIKRTLNITLDLLYSTKYFKRLSELISTSIKVFIENDKCEMLDDLLIKIENYKNKSFLAEINYIYFICTDYYGIETLKGRSFFYKGLSLIK